MTHKVARIGNTLVVRWYDTDVASLETIQHEIASARRAAGEDLIYISISAADTPAPSQEARKKMLELIKGALPHIAHFFVVLEASGFRGSVQRTAMAGLMLMFDQSNRIKVLGSLDEVWKQLDAAGARYNRQGILAAIASEKMLATSAASS